MANNIFTLLAIPPIKSGIMDNLLPSQIRPLVLATGLKMGKKDKEIYMNPFRLIIGNMKWLMGKLDDGYTFTLLSPEEPFNVVWDKLPETKTSLALLVTKDQKFVPCTRDFMSRRVFEHRESPIAVQADNLFEDNEPNRRVVVVKWRQFTFEVNLPLADQNTAKPLILNPIYHQPWAVPSFKRSPMIDFGTPYLHANKGSGVSGFELGYFPRFGSHPPALFRIESEFTPRATRYVFHFSIPPIGS